MKTARMFILVALMVALYDLAVAVAVMEDSRPEGNRKLLAFVIPSVPVNPMTGFINGAAGTANGFINTANGIVAGALAPVIGACF
ncbi:hypothetical protein HOP50_05g36330 [Chloropicon primus]|uniref:Uncharacterized protein n=1 Tax=Chloropicon primus TaxID=1764295 RepID=A0A5B8MNI3_9CHLO|nr:hypothetical protein A3770_05p36230 [Chloropicon primus]UPR00319.1 hypothetical protein HOP50_05g36330 [Chloropicon primus]|mmetsp:Transcript_4067/g.11831  ORF Transcript_4067/g.11831 Transcript_4067/m.11831 type:complete len:85 (+) Transcript_4067:146-400(+)|eukprot:QDZ21105.1 hypothetical protein A3770_05p36230 [Chloropicon primus]